MENLECNNVRSRAEVKERRKGSKEGGEKGGRREEDDKTVTCIKM